MKVVQTFNIDEKSTAVFVGPLCVCRSQATQMTLRFRYYDGSI